MKKIKALVDLVVELNMRTIDNLNKEDSEFIHGYIDGVMRVLTDLNRVFEVLNEDN
jgi:hypothetical protein